MTIVDVVLVNFNSGPLLFECLNSLQTLTAETDTGWTLGTVAVVDNASTDGSLKPLKSLERLPLKVVTNEVNQGFAAACNQGAAAGTGDLILFLNPDTAFLEDALSPAVQCLQGRKDVGICGVRLVDEEGGPNVAGARFPSPGIFLADSLGLSRLGLTKPHLYSPRELDRDRPVDQVIGAFFLTRRSLFLEAGGFDERFFVYFEEVDYARRLFAQGHLSYYLHEPRLYHLGGGTTHKIKARRLFYSLRSRLQYGKKHFSFLGASWLYLTTLFVEPWPRIIAAMIGLSSASILQTLKGYGLLWSWLLTGKPQR